MENLGSTYGGFPNLFGNSMIRKIVLALSICMIFQSCVPGIGNQDQNGSVADLLALLGIGQNNSGNSENTAPPSGLAFTGTPYSFRQGSSINSVTPTVTGNLTSCTATPSLPVGLTLNATTCAISGTPSTANPTTTTYKITGTNSNGSTSTDIGIQITSNGSVWTQRTLPSSRRWMSVAFGNGVFVAVAYASNVAATSSDGITWTERTLPSSNNWIHITFGNGLFIAVAGTSAATSTDGITWTARSLPGAAGAVAFGNGRFVTVVSGNNNTASSTNGISWTASSHNCGSGIGCGGAIAYGNGLFVSVGGQGATSTSDGTNWTNRTTPSTGLTGISYGNGRFIAFSTGHVLSISNNGIDWTSYENTNFCCSVKKSDFGNGLFIFVEFDKSSAWTSLDGATWTARTLPSVRKWSSVAYGNGIFVAVSGDTNTNSDVSASSP